LWAESSQLGVQLLLSEHRPLFPPASSSTPSATPSTASTTASRRSTATTHAPEAESLHVVPVRRAGQWGVEFVEQHQGHNAGESEMLRDEHSRVAVRK